MILLIEYTYAMMCMIPRDGVTGVTSVTRGVTAFVTG